MVVLFKIVTSSVLFNMDRSDFWVCVDSQEKNKREREKRGIVRSVATAMPMSCFRLPKLVTS